MYPNPPSTSTSSTYNFLQFQSETTNTINGDDNTNYSGGASGSGGAAGGGVTSWSKAVQPPPTTSGLIRQSSSPPAFFHQHLISDFGISHKKDGEGYNHPQALVSSHKHKQSRLSSDTSHARRLSSLKRASTSSTPSTSRGFTIGPWEECDSIDVFDPQVHDLSKIGSIDKLNVADEDSVAWRIRAKRGFATDPRSIAERERRIRINCKLKKLEELLPNIDKQTSYAEMLDLAFEHVKGLQSQIQELNEELDSCTCGCNHDE